MNVRTVRGLGKNISSVFSKSLGPKGNFFRELFPGNTVLGAVFHSFKNIFVILIAVKG